ncbi:pentatricopeptide repeat-containing protein At2g20540-like [Lycium barbarum]|uniref:pentatricopeptide repeat-containing protein At2g20540-like n=1 Tax=Lycium barbarum TaxID=112863 RepID=UPI00293F14C3|nr:pentatricopeptide repeat-containing protein At2g20540-like [Lycium barbarum]XP_060204774.1 pentatricopeptide repeat-containing protein At2g20540-like [Lycium barbarum]
MRLLSWRKAKHLTVIKPKYPIFTYSSTTNFPAVSQHKIHITRKELSKLLHQRPPKSQLKQIHAQILTQQLSSTASLVNSLIHCYLHIKEVTSARFLFFHYPLPSPPILIWNLMIRAYCKLQNSSESFSLFRQLLNLDHSIRVFPDEYTFTFIVTSCAHQKSIVQGKIVHGLVVRNGLESNLYVGNSLINMYAAFKITDDAYKVFDRMTERDVFSWTSLICGYANNGEMYEACEIFYRMPMRNDVSWAVIISGFAGNGRYMEVLMYLNEMFCSLEDKVRPNEAVLVCALSACANLGALEQGNWIHAFIKRNEIHESSNISTALIDMYAKCGRIDIARLIFDRIPRPDVHNFTSMISGLSYHGLGEHALTVFNRMVDEKVNPNEVTIIGVLNACSHSGLVEEGSSIFYNMESLWGLKPQIEHYGCYVDLLGRAGYLEKALEVVKSMHIKPDIVIWRALLSACRIHRNIFLGNSIIDFIKQLNSDGPSGSEVLLSNLYASLGNWEKVSEVRKAMGQRKTQSDIGCSWIEVNGVVHEFRVADKLHPQILEVLNKLNELWIVLS